MSIVLLLIATVGLTLAVLLCIGCAVVALIRRDDASSAKFTILGGVLAIVIGLVNLVIQ